MACEDLVNANSRYEESLKAKGQNSGGKWRSYTTLEMTRNARYFKVFKADNTLFIQ
jgi:hypothetical protein